MSQIVKGSFYTGIAKYFHIICQLLITAVLARILTPSDFGVVAISTVVMTFFDIFADAGLGPAVVQSKDMEDKDYSNVFSFSLYFSICIVLIFLSIIKPLATFYKEAILVKLFLLLSIQLFFMTLNVVPRALLLKEKAFRELSFISMTSIVVFGGISIVAAIMGAGVYSLVITPIGSSIYAFVMCKKNEAKRLRLILRPSFAPVKQLLSFSIYQFSFNIVNFFSRNLDKLLMGKYLGMSDLGYYEKSYRMMTLPISTLTNVFSPTIQPVLASHQNDKPVLLESYYKITRVLVFFGALIVPFLFFSAEELIFIIFGNQWGGAVPIFKVLALSCLFQLADSISGGFLQAANAARNLFISGVICAITNICFLLLGLLVFGDLYSTAICVSVSFTLNLFISAFYIVKLTLKGALKDYLVLFIKPIIVLVVCALFLYGISLIPLNSFILSLLIKTALTGLIALFFNHLFHFLDFSKIFKVIRFRRHD